MKIKEIAFVCRAVSDMSRARAFYEGVLGLKANAPVGPDPYCIKYDVGAGTFAIESNPDWPVSPDGMSVTFEVDDFEALSDTCVTTASPSSSDRLKRKFVIGRRFAIPTEIGSSFTSESESHSFHSFSQFRIDRISPLLHRIAP
jgi:catechol 2,3-dioxygenase-like lactoylglutathione lyase family enzyme